MLRGENLVYDAGRTRLVDDASLTVTPGEVVALLGRTGAGKSTLLRLLAGDLAPSGGTVQLHGRPLGQWPAAELARLRAVDEVGVAMLMPGGGHGIAGSANMSNVELFAYPVPR